MRLKFSSFNVLVMVIVFGSFICFLKIFALPRKTIYPPRPAPASTKEFTYDSLLHYMGYPSLTRWSKKNKEKLESFFASVQVFAISKVERQLFIELLRQFQVLCQQNNIIFFLYYGGLLGAFRHHGLTPWDDDLDVLMPLSSKAKFEKLLKNHSVLAYGKKGKFVSPVFLKDEKKSQPIKKRKWRWPYIEVHFYEVKKKKKKMVHHFESCGAYKVSDIFPLIEVPFENMTMPAPRRMDCLVSQCYKNSTTRCCTHTFSHSDEKLGQKGHKCIDCKLLSSVFPFVSSRHRHGEYVIEQVFLNGIKIATKRLKMPNCTVH